MERSDVLLCRGDGTVRPEGIQAVPDRVESLQKDCIRLVFPSGERIADKSGLLIGDYADGRRLALFHNLDEVEQKKASLQRAVRKWLETLDKS